MDIKVVSGYSTNRVELSSGDTGTDETCKSWGLALSSWGPLRGYRVPVLGCDLRAGRRTGGRGIKSQFGLLSWRPVTITTSGTWQQEANKLETREGFRVWQQFMTLHIQCLTSLIYLLRHWCRVFPYNPVFCANRDGRALPKTKLYYCLWEFLLSCT